MSIRIDDNTIEDSFSYTNAIVILRTSTASEAIGISRDVSRLYRQFMSFNQTGHTTDNPPKFISFIDDHNNLRFVNTSHIIEIRFTVIK